MLQRSNMRPYQTLMGQQKASSVPATTCFHAVAQHVFPPGHRRNLADHLCFWVSQRGLLKRVKSSSPSKVPFFNCQRHLIFVSGRRCLAQLLEGAQAVAACQKGVDLLERDALQVSFCRWLPAGIKSCCASGHLRMRIMGIEPWRNLLDYISILSLLLMLLLSHFLDTCTLPFKKL